MSVNANDFKQLIVKLENLQEEKDEVAAHLKDAFDEAKSQGYDVKTLKTILNLRKKDPEKLKYEDEILETYRAAAGV